MAQSTQDSTEATTLDGSTARRAAGAARFSLETSVDGLATPRLGWPSPEQARVGQGLVRHTLLWWPGRHLGLGVSLPAPEAAWSGEDAGAGQVRPYLALNFRVGDPYAGLRQGSLLRFSVSQQTRIALRPRGGRFTVQLQSQW